jgi:hypothetical protein
MYIQYRGFNVVASSRIYNFDVIDIAKEAREFTVKVQSETFRPAHLKFQDGPGICFERLRHEMEQETPELCAQSHLRIDEQNVQEYLARHHPHKKAFGQRSEGVFNLNPRTRQAFPAAEQPVSGLRT